MNIIILIIASNNSNEYIEMQNIWRKYMNNHPNIKSFFIKNDLNIDTDIYLNENLNTIYTKDIETYSPGIFNKTIKSIEYCLNNFKFDYIYRTNLSSFLELNKMYNFISNNHIEYGGVIGNHNNINFASGSGFFISKEACNFLINYDRQININEYLDDVIIAKILTKKYKIDFIDRIDINKVDNISTYNTDTGIFHYRCKSDCFHTLSIMNNLYDIFY